MSNVLGRLDIENNHLTGKIFDGIGNLHNLEYMWLGENQLSGTLIEEIGNMSSIEDLDLKSNKLTGTIPESFANLRTLKRLLLVDNLLVGRVPDSLCSTFNDKDKDLYVNSKVPDYDYEHIECACCTPYSFTR